MCCGLMVVSGSWRRLVIEENAVYDMYLWYMSLDDVDYLVEKFYLYSIQ
jgi:hypothetical protein